MSETYRIDEGAGVVVRESDGERVGEMSFAHLERVFPRRYERQNRMAEERGEVVHPSWHVYAIARDELLDRGLIADTAGVQS